MKQSDNGTYNEMYRYWEKKLNQPYDYRHKGLLKHLVSKRIANTNNPILKDVMAIYESMCIFAMKFADILSNFHNFTKPNR